MSPHLGPSEFAALYRASAPRLWCIAAAVTGDRSLADDALQEAALIALRKLADFEVGTRFDAWMGQIVRNVSRNFARQRSRRRMASDAFPLDSIPGRGEPSVSGPVSSAGVLRDEQDEFDDRTIEALNELPETARVCLLLRTVLDVPHRDIARLLDIPEGTAMSHVYRARATMRRRLAETTTPHGDDSS